VTVLGFYGTSVKPSQLERSRAPSRVGFIPCATIRGWRGAGPDGEGIAQRFGDSQEFAGDVPGGIEHEQAQPLRRWACRSRRSQLERQVGGSGGAQRGFERTPAVISYWIQITYVARRSA
jgi:hypothetical protein